MKRRVKEASPPFPTFSHPRTNLLTKGLLQVKTVYSGQEMTREKYVLFIADAIEPVSTSNLGIKRT